MISLFPKSRTSQDVIRNVLLFGNRVAPGSLNDESLQDQPLQSSAQAVSPTVDSGPVRPSLFKGLTSDDQGISQQPQTPQPDQPSSLNDYGVARPSGTHQKWWQTLLNMVPVTLAGISEHKGILPSAALAYEVNNAANNKSQDDAMTQFDKDRSFRQKDAEIKSNNDLKKTEFDALSGYRDKSLGLQQQKIDISKNKKSSDDKKLQEIQSYATTLNDQLSKLGEDINPDAKGSIPGHFGTGTIVNALGKTGMAPWSKSQADFESKMTPIVDTYVKMTAGRANKEILHRMMDDLEKAKTGPGDIRQTKLAALKDYLDTEYRNTAIAHGADPDNLPSLENLNATANKASNTSGRAAASVAGTRKAKDGSVWKVDAEGNPIERVK